MRRRSCTSAANTAGSDVIDAVIFDLDGVLIQTEEIWDEIRERFVRERGGRYDADAQRAMMGMSSLEWSRFIHDELGVADDPTAISAEVVRRMEARRSASTMSSRPWYCACRRAETPSPSRSPAAAGAGCGSLRDCSPRSTRTR